MYFSIHANFILCTRIAAIQQNWRICEAVREEEEEEEEEEGKREMMAIMKT